MAERNLTVSDQDKLKHPRFYGSREDYVHKHGDLLTVYPIDDMKPVDPRKWELMEYTRISWVPAIWYHNNEYFHSPVPCSVFRYENRLTGAPLFMRKTMIVPVFEWPQGTRMPPGLY